MVKVSDGKGIEREEKCQLQEIELCPIVESLKLLGGINEIIVLRYLMDGPKRFNELLKLTGFNPKTLSNSLKYLISVGLVSRKVMTEPIIAAYYSLTPMGQDLKQVMDSLYNWGNKWFRSKIAGKGSEVNNC